VTLGVAPTLGATMGCSSSHRAADAGACSGDAPSCYEDTPGEPGCCRYPTSLGTLCVDGSWVCPSARLLVSECVDYYPRCGDGPLLDSSVPPPAPDGSVPPPSADGSVPPPPADGGAPTECAGLPEGLCAAHPACAPVYDDACCPGCEMGPCADCASYFYHRCEPKTRVCEGTAFFCGLTPRWACTGGTADCSSAGSTGAGGCALVPGCVADALEPSSCAPITEGTCAIRCRSVCTCPMGTICEGDGFCMTGRCIEPSVCF
ncbi:MAG: hypothetical protein OEY14_13630, partial [Myxococcales bacterium]|nr:hypothetical protein [Myxococcales bacterium]